MRASATAITGKLILTTVRRPRTIVCLRLRRASGTVLVHSTCQPSSLSGPWGGFLHAARREYFQRKRPFIPAPWCGYEVPGGLASTDGARTRYNEGVKVLYASNTFHIRSRNLRAFGGFIPQIPETGLSYITSMELVLDPRFAASPKTDDPASEADILEGTVSRIANLMPRLQTLYLGFCPWTCLRKDCASGYKLTYECSKYHAGLVETTVRDLHQAGRSCELELGLPWTLYNQYLDEANQQPSRLKVAGPHWRPGMKSNCSWFSRMRFFCHVQDQRLDPDSENEVRTGTDVGYWMSLSSFDLDFTTVRCFGT
jgi:hypothetical protein